MLKAIFVWTKSYVEEIEKPYRVWNSEILYKYFLLCDLSWATEKPFSIFAL